MEKITLPTLSDVFGWMSTFDLAVLILVSMGGLAAMIGAFMAKGRRRSSCRALVPVHALFSAAYGVWVYGGHLFSYYRSSLGVGLNYSKSESLYGEVLWVAAMFGCASIILLLEVGMIHLQLVFAARKTI